MTATAITSLGEDTAVPIFGIVSSRAINKAYEMELVAFGLDNGLSPLKPLGCTPPSPRVNKLERTSKHLPRRFRPTKLIVAAPRVCRPPGAPLPAGVSFATARAAFDARQFASCTVALRTGRRLQMLPRPWSLLLLVLITGCSPSLPGTLVGESAHFRLFIDPDIDTSTLAASQQGQLALDALEADWADKQSMLQMPEGKQKIDYHLMTGQHIAQACNVEFGATVTESGCEVVGKLEIAAGYLPHQHELMHAYMDLVAPGHLPIPFVGEGTAQAIGCNTNAGTDLAHDLPWQEAVVEVARDARADVYSEGGLFARYLIRTQGIDAFVRYYRQAPERRDPALFAANFSNFWSMSVDDVWAAMHVVESGAASTDDAICPCSLPALPPDGQPIPSGPTHPYWPVGDLQGASVGITCSSCEVLSVRDCEGIGPILKTDDDSWPRNLPSSTDFTALGIFQLGAGRSHYVPLPITPITSASVGDYLSDTCGASTPYVLPADFLTGAADVSVLSDPAPPQDVRYYLQLQVPFTGHVSPDGGAGVCGSCDFIQAGCALLAGDTTPVAPGLLDVAVLPSQMGSMDFDTAYGVGTVVQFSN